MTIDDLQRWLDRYGNAWVERDPAAAAELFAVGARYHETPFDPPLAGRAGIREYWEDVPRSQEHITFSSRALVVAGATGVAQWQSCFTRIPSRRRVELDGVFLLQFDDAGRCTELREWWHRREDGRTGERENGRT
jgi:ketosteroid isomerase-like protein